MAATQIKNKSESEAGMKILEYNDVDPLKVMYVNQLALDFALTPELVAHIRQTDPRPFPCLAVYAVEDDTILGQVGIFRLPMISTEGREDVGGIWAVSTHPQYAQHGVASRLLEEAHIRMRAAGLRFSTLGTNRYRVAYQLYRQNGYKETNVWATALARWETAHQPTRLRARPLGPEGYDFVEQIYQNIAKEYLGFAWRHTPFARLRLVNLVDIWILSENSRLVGYVFARVDSTMLTISNLVLHQGIDTAEAIAAIASELKSAYVQVKLSRPVEVSSLRQAGYHVAHPTWGGFMIKPLVPEVTAEDARRLFGVGTDLFMISWLDVT
jgi:GNAT superfamily N-acetyltransferase